MNIFYVIFSVLVTGGIFAWLFSHVSLAEVAGLLRGVDPRGVALFVLASLLMSVFRAWRYRIILRVSGPAPGTLPLFLAVIVRNTFSDLLPARLGSLVYIYVATARLGIPFGAASSSFALAFVFDMIALAPLIAWAAVGLGGASVWVLAGFGLVLAAGMIAVLHWLPALVGIVGRRVAAFSWLGHERGPRWAKALEDVACELRAAREAGIYGRVFVLSLMVRLFKYAALYFFLFALVAPLGYGWAALPVPRVLAGLCAAEAAASLPVSGLAGFGAYEGAWAMAFQLLLFPAPLARATSIAHHLFTQLYGYGSGAVALLLLLLPFWRRARPPEREALESAGRFAARLAAALTVAAGMAVLLYRVCPEARAEAAPVSAGDVSALENLAGRVRGRVVFQRPDGIYVVRLGARDPERIVSPGEFPRWSPDGRDIAFLQSNRVMRLRLDGGEPEALADAFAPRALAWHPSGREIYFTDGLLIRAVNVETRAARDVLSGHVFRELDVAPDGRLAATVRGRGVSIMGFDPGAGRSWRIAGGCSASLSPDGNRVTNNEGDHRRLSIRDAVSGARLGTVNAPAGMAFDNQWWSNDPNWLASRSEGLFEDVFVHDLLKNEAVRVTFVGQCDRPDLFIESGD
ncbi:MAG TPA: lysylphosphatidylglycerol synthase domain-containing protein [Kiritimatiellia bacterium]|nr:lysylphosphatidylglycerol synthase domain-containing protein [Kiritimatiellia bacterium]HRZ11802.1 lysylphosphatidylglycerol synthase domain-containing protein [Kiritimatiellia bacterium]HSA17392.1 lysylphosphatidylglycerol synthase domain-containing protein [Kiritimatiellia bacterium]